MITNNSFLDGITHRQMRRHLLETFDEIYIFNLHGDTKKEEKAPDGGKDENVFGIQQGVSINIFIRSNEDKKGLGIVFYTEIFGEEEKKYKVLNESNIATKKREKKWKKLNCAEPNFFFVRPIQLRSATPWLRFEFRGSEVFLKRIVKTSMQR